MMKLLKKKITKMSFMVYEEQFWEKLVKITLSFKIIHNVMKFKHIF